MHPIELLLQLFQYDIGVMTQAWTYYTVVPIIGCTIFFFFKWTVLTMPIWLPFLITVGAAARARASSPRKMYRLG